MLTGELRNKVDQVWNAFWSGGIANPLEVIEQITYLLFLRRLDDLETLEENKAARLGEPMTRGSAAHAHACIYGHAPARDARGQGMTGVRRSGRPGWA